MVPYIRVVLCVMMVTKCWAERPEVEPTCYSRFDFEEKLLKKTIRMEHKMEVLEENMKDKIEELGDKILEIKGKLGTYHYLPYKYSFFQ